MRRRSAHRCAVALIVAGGLSAAAIPSVAAAGGAATQMEVAAEATTSPGVQLSPEVAALPASSPELDAARRNLEELEHDRAVRTRDLADTEHELAADTAELAVLGPLVERRSAQVEELRRTDDRLRSVLSSLLVDRYIEGDHMLEGLDPMLTSERRNRLERQLVLGQVGTDHLLDQRRRISGRILVLRRQIAKDRSRRAELEDRVGELTELRTELQASLDALGARVTSAERRRDAARGAATVNGTDVSALALDAYWRAQRYLALTDPSCSLRWPVLAGIGRTESRHGTYHGATLGVDGVVSPPIYGPELDGSNTFAVVPDSDGGGLDGTSATDRAVGPMQFLPGTWRTVGTDLSGDGRADPQNLFDAAASAGVYLCRSGPNLEDPARLRRSVLSYNRSQSYADTVTERIRNYSDAIPLR